MKEIKHIIKDVHVFMNPDTDKLQFTATVVQDNRFIEGTRIRSSAIINFSIADKTITTRNTIYHVVTE